VSVRTPNLRMRASGAARRIGLLLVIALGASAGAGVAFGQTGKPSPEGKPPDQEPPHRVVKRYEIGQGPRSYWLFEPDEPKPDERAPVVVLLHGWFAVNPGFYGAWIEHLVRHGKIVIFPRYQNDVGTLPLDFLPNTLAAVRDALGVLSDGVGHVRPDPARFALIGHSVGGTLAAQTAATSADPHSGIPAPHALVLLMPGEIVPMSQPSLAHIPATTLMIVVVGEEDLVVGDRRGRQIFTEASAIPAARKRFILFRSDRHGSPPLIADHTAPTGVHSRLDNGEGVFRWLQLSVGDVNALDHAGFWRITDLTMHAAFASQTLDDVTKDDERFRHLGYWSDGRKVNPPLVGVDLDAIPRVIPGNGLRIFPLSAAPKASTAPETRRP
jgi:pimeloyl-ACP methyl ester carboxylesterase